MYSVSSFLMNGLKKMNSIVDTIKARALKLGFDDCGIASIHDTVEDAEIFKAWLSRGYHANMQYMESNIDVRTNPRLYHANAKSVIVVVQNYYQEPLVWSSSYGVAMFARFYDYHYALKDRLEKLLEQIRELYPQLKGTISVDSAPVLERYWAVKAGLGFIGQNTMFIHPKLGSFVFLGTIVVDQWLEPDVPNTDTCQNCGKCIAACPNGALEQSFTLNARKCISYQTIERNNDDLLDVDIDVNNQIFGCDICNMVCPHNQQAVQSTVFKSDKSICLLTDDEWDNVASSGFKRLFASTPIKRIGVKGIRRNIAHIKKSRE